ncbi:MAG TPA: phage major capsid protein, partial [Anaerolineales bacterium]|nr:phage major capsid protein [Anaerolineales bacterium]
SEGIAEDGGFLLQHDFATEALDRVYGTGEIMKLVNRRAIGAGANGLTINVINETSRATGSRFGGVRAYWLNEGGTKTASRPTYRRFVLPLEKLIGLYYATDELLQDATGLGGEVSSMFSLEIQFAVEDAIVNGNGAGLPLGVLAAPATVSVAKETGQAANTIVYQNLVKMWARMWAPSRKNAVWLVNQDAEPQLDQLSLAVGTGGLEPRFVTYGPDGVMRIKGRPVVPVEYCQTLGTVGDILLADFGGYRFIDKGGLKADVSIHVQFTTDESAFRWVYRCNGAPFWNSAVTPKNGTSTLSQFVSLATRA